jgi:pentatricopeptide repeat protein
MLKLIEDAEAKEAYLVDKIPERNVFHYNVVLQAWAKRKNLSRLIALFDSMKHHGVAADVNTYTCVIVALTKSGQPEHVEKADACLAEMEQLNLRPDVVHYEAVLLAWTDLKDAARATKVLIRRIHAATERPALAPVPANFHNITTLWMHSGNPKQAALIVLRLFDFADQGLLKRGPDERTRFLITSTLVREFKPEYQPVIDQLNLRRRDPPTTKRTAPLPPSPAAASSSAAAPPPPTAPPPTAPLPSLTAPPLPSSPFSSAKLTTLPPRVSNDSNNQDATAAATTPHRVSRLP